MKMYVGTSGFGYKEWKGKFYPEKISPKEMLRFYSGRLNSVEINNTFYHMPKESVLASWAEQASEGFVFAVKAPQVITHLKHLRNVDAETAYFFKALLILKKKLGPILFQFPKSFPVDESALRNFLDLVPGDILCSFEFRNPTWLEGSIPDLLRERGFSICIADTDENPANNLISTAPWGYLRLRRSDYSDADLSEWQVKIGFQQWEKVFVFFKHEEEARGPEMAARFLRLIDAGENKKSRAS